MCKIKRDHSNVIPFSRGIERIRTAVGAFAELSLAARPRYRFFIAPLFSGIAKVGNF